MALGKFDPQLYPNLHPIFLACRKGDVCEVQHYLDQGVSIHISDANHASLLAAAIEGGYVNMVRLLIARGVNPNEPLNRFGETPISRAISEGQNEIVLEMINAGVDLNKADNTGSTPLFAASTSNLAMLKLILETGVNVNMKNQNGRTAMIEAAVSNRLDNLELLLAAGARLEERDAHGSTALISAAKRGSCGACQWLLDHGADINAEDNRGKSPLAWAKANGHAEVVDLLQKRLDS